MQPFGAQPCSGEPRLADLGDDCADGGLVGLRGGGGEGECHLGKAQLEQAIAAPRLAVIVALRRRAAEDLDLPVVQPEAAVDRRDLRFERALIRQKQPRRAAFDDRGRDCAAVDVGQRLRREDDARVLLPQRLQPFAQLAGEASVVECEPAFVDDEQRGPPVEAILDAVEDRASRRGRCPGVRNRGADRRGGGARRALLPLRTRRQTMRDCHLRRRQGRQSRQSGSSQCPSRFRAQS